VSQLWHRAEEVAQQLRRQGRFAQNGPIDVEALAAALHVDVQPADIPEDGRFVPRPRGGLVLYRRNQPPQRVRFTIAHELIHLALRDPAVGGSAASHAVARGGFRSVERLCDCGGAALLMPRSWVLKTYGREASRQDASLGLVLHVARSAFVSPAAAFLRLQSLFAWHRVLMSWRRERRKWLMSSEVGTFVPASAVPRLGDSLDHFLHRAYARGAARMGLGNEALGVFEDFLPVFHPTYDAFLPTEVVVSGRTGSVSVMIDPAAEPIVVAAHDVTGESFAI
jgi:uncharacterized protein DUF955